MNSREMRQKRDVKVKAMSAIIDGATKGNRELTAHEQQAWDRLESEVDAEGETVKRVERQELIDAQQRGTIGTVTDRPGNGDGDPGIEIAESGILDPDHSVCNFVARTHDPHEYGNLSAGQFLRAAVLGPKNDVERRALGGATDSAGGFTVPSILSAELIDALRARLVCQRAGARIVPLESDHHSYAKLLTDPVAGWRAENAVVAESDPTFGRVLFEPKTLAVIIKASREVIEDSLNIEQALMSAFANSMAVEVDRVALMGTGTSNQPRGIANTSDVHSISMGTNGAALTNYAPLVEGMGKVLQSNSEVRAFVMAPRTWAELALLKTGITGDERQLPMPEQLKDIPFLVTSSVPITETQGTATEKCSRIILGNYRDLWLGIRTELRVEVLKERFADYLQFGFLAFLRMDVGVTQPKSFCQIIGIIEPA